MKQLSAALAVLTLAGLVSATAYAQTVTTTPTTTTTPTQATPVSLTQNCAVKGTRTLTGSYDAKTGALNTLTTFTGCVVRNGDKYDGTTSTIGTVLGGATGFTIDITANVNTTVTLSDLSKVTRTCTTTKKGTFTHANQTFDGTTAQNNCSVTGKVLEHENVLEHLLRPNMGDSNDGGKDASTRTLPPQAGEDSVREQH
jgi:hypothetical protein